MTVINRLVFFLIAWWWMNSSFGVLLNLIQYGCDCVKHESIYVGAFPCPHSTHRKLSSEHKTDRRMDFGGVDLALSGQLRGL
jgi:hypothetical protein